MSDCTSLSTKNLADICNGSSISGLSLSYSLPCEEAGVWVAEILPNGTTTLSFVPAATQWLSAIRRLVRLLLGLRRPQLSALANELVRTEFLHISCELFGADAVSLMTPVHTLEQVAYLLENPTDTDSFDRIGQHIDEKLAAYGRQSATGKWLAILAAIVAAVRLG